MELTPKDAEARVTRTLADWNSLRRHYSQFIEYASRFGKPDCPVKGILAEVKDGALILGYAGRTVRIWLDFDRMSELGLIVVDDISKQVGPPRPIRVGVVEFNATGSTNIQGGLLGGPFQLDQPSDAWHLSMAILDAALDVKLSDQ